MEPLSQFHPFRTDPSWYETYWLTDRPAQPPEAKPQGLWFERLRGVVSVAFSTRLRAHMDAAAQARQRRLGLGQV